MKLDFFFVWPFIPSSSWLLLAFPPHYQDERFSSICFYQLRERVRPGPFPSLIKLISYNMIAMGISILLSNLILRNFFQIKMLIYWFCQFNNNSRKSWRFLTFIFLLKISSNINNLLWLMHALTTHGWVEGPKRTNVHNSMS